MAMLHPDDNPSTPGKFKTDRYYYIHRPRWHSSISSKITFSLFVFSTTTLLLLFLLLLKPSSSFSSPSPLKDPSRRSLSTHPSWGGAHWERRVLSSSRPRSDHGLTVLVTGAAGFVGSHVSIFLRRRGDGVLGLDNFNDYYDPDLKRDRQSFLESSGIFVVHGDINDGELLTTLFDAVAFTHVMHLAAQAGVRYAMQNPSSYVHSNVKGFVSLLEVCKSANPQPAVVWASSSSVYGLNTKVPFSEKDRTDQPASLYAATKKAGEAIAHAYSHIHGVSITCLRFFTVYGPWGRPDMAYFSFTRDILKKKAITIFEGPGHASVARDFTYVDDVVKGCVAALDTAARSGRKKGTAAQYRVYNLGNTVPVSVMDLVKMLERLLKVKAEKKVKTMPRNGDVRFTHANISLAERELGYRPATNLHIGLKKFVSWYLSYYGLKKKTSW